MPGFMPDTNCIVASISSWHEHHDRAAGEIERRLNHGDRMLVAGHAVVEAYSVLTRLPPPHRLSANIAWRAISEGFLAIGEMAILSAEGYRDLLAGAASAGIVGGAIYDAVIAACAAAADADALLTFNDRHFQRIAPARLEIVVPSV